MVTLALLGIAFGVTTDYQQERPVELNIPEKIMETVVIADSASGIIVYSDEERTLVLTAHHVVDDAIEKTACCGCDYGVDVSLLHVIAGVMPVFESYDVVNIEFEESTDLAVLEIHPKKVFRHSRVAKNSPRLGDDIWLAGNPDRVYRSLKKGIISSKERWVGGSSSWEISGGVIFGSSGGGIFNMDGELVGIMKAVNIYMSRQCYDLWDTKGEWMGYHCIQMPTPFIGYATPRFFVEEFLLESSYGSYFDYLR